MFKYILFCAASVLVAGQKASQQGKTTVVRTQTTNQTYQTTQVQGQQGQQGQQSQGQRYQPGNQQPQQYQNGYQTQTTQQSQQSQQTQQNQQGSSGIVGGGIISRQPTPAASNVFLNYNDSILLLLDHQSGLFQTVKDVPQLELRNNVIVLAKIAQHTGIPIITTASEPNGSNGPLFDELANMNLTYVPRQGEVSAWDNADFVNAVQNSGKKTLIIAGVWTSVCVTFPALQALADGYKVYAVMDASGDYSPMAFYVTLARLTQAGVIPVTSNVILGEIQRTWNRPDAAQWAEYYGAMVPNYKAAEEQYARAQLAALGKAPTVAQQAPTPYGR